ncbi:MAG: ATP-binding protein [Phycisphaerales bacterium]|jgi:signal transduction histidine kinase/CheY-like chemotaxis protein|nr:ATP-binding protein [Phycisphaerales bacterium]
MRVDPAIRFPDPARSNAAVRPGGSTVVDHPESENARSSRSTVWPLGFGFRRPILVRLYERVSNFWLLLTLASGVVAATGLTFESVLVAGIGLALMFAAMLGLSTDLRRSRPEIARGSACRSGGAGCWAWQLADGTAWYDQCFQRLIGDPIGPTILQAGLFETLLGRIHADDLAQFHFAVDATIEGGADLDCTVRLRTPDGEWRAIRFIGGCDAGSAGESDCINGIALPEDRDRIASSLASRTGDDLLCALSDQAKLTRDLERIRVDLEERNRQLEEARAAAVEATQAKSEFLANMSHEIRTPLTAIIGYADLLVGDEGDPDSRHSMLETVRRSGEHLLALVSEILDLSKIEAGRMETDRVPTDAIGCVRDVAESLGEQARGKGLEITVDISDRVPPAMSLDPTRFRQIVVNLLGNAIKFTETGGITLELDHEPDGDLLTLCVADTGIGMVDSEMDRIFEPFRQADGSTTRRFGGTGLGLAISRRLCEMLGGSLTVQSRFGIGSTFSAMVTAAPAEAAIFMEGKTDVPTGLRVLLAEDGPDNRRLIGHLLGRLGAHVVAVENGQEAVDAVQKSRDRPFDLVILDMQMPILDGYEAASQLRNAGNDVPILALTANAMPGDRMVCLEAGCNDYLSKPVRRDDLAASIARLTHASPRWRKAG